MMMSSVKNDLSNQVRNKIMDEGKSQVQNQLLQNVTNPLNPVSNVENLAQTEK
jgi:hypothetical protein